MKIALEKLQIQILK